MNDIFPTVENVRNICSKHSTIQIEQAHLRPERVHPGLGPSRMGGPPMAERANFILEANSSMRDPFQT